MKVTIVSRTAHRRHPLLAALGLALIAVLMISCGSPNANFGRILLSISVTPATADAQKFQNGQVVFTATGTFNQSPFSVPVPSTPPYSGKFFVDTTATNQVIATIVSSGSGTATVQCISGMSGTVNLGNIASANNGTSTTVTGLAQITCP
jgi:hypothetical protein